MFPAQQRFSAPLPLPPKHCEPPAYDSFVWALRNLRSMYGLVEAATALSLHAVDDAAYRNVRRQLDDVAATVARRVRRWTGTAVLTHLHCVLFDEFKFAAPAYGYCRPAHCYLPMVLALRSGVPASLALVYKAVAERLGLHVHGVRIASDFLVRVTASGETLLVDPSLAGKVVTPAEALERASGAGLRNAANDLHRADLQRAVTHREWIRLLLGRLQRMLAADRREADVAAICELQLALNAA